MTEIERELARLRKEQAELQAAQSEEAARLQGIEQELANQESSRRLLESHVTVRQLGRDIEELKRRERAERAALSGKKGQAICSSERIDTVGCC